jgi:DNA-binding response OmpR family regulator
MLCEFLWNPDWEGVTNVIEVHINRLRSKISDNGTEPQMIFTVRGSGYVLRWDPSAPPPPPEMRADGEQMIGSK